MEKKENIAFHIKNMEKGIQTPKMVIDRHIELTWLITKGYLLLRQGLL